MARVLLLATTTGYQTRAFGEAAARLGDRARRSPPIAASVLDDPWRGRRDRRPVSTTPHRSTPCWPRRASGRSTACSSSAIGRPCRRAGRGGARTAGPSADGRRGRAQQAADARAPARGRPARAVVRPACRSTLTPELDRRDARRIPCVVKPLALSGSRGVMRADDRAGFVAAFSPAAGAARLARRPGRAQRPARRGARRGLHSRARVRGRGAAAPRRAAGARDLRQAGSARRPVLRGDDLRDAVRGAARDRSGNRRGRRRARPRRSACGTVRSTRSAASTTAGVFVLEVAARPIGGLCARALRFTRGAETIALEELLLRHALGEAPDALAREARGVGRDDDSRSPAAASIRGVSGVEAARAVPGVDDVRITAKTDQLLLPLPEGASYLGFIFARGETAAEGRARAARGARAAARSRSIPNCGSSRRGNSGRISRWLIAAGRLLRTPRAPTRAGAK